MLLLLSGGGSRETSDRLLVWFAGRKENAEKSGTTAGRSFVSRLGSFLLSASTQACAPAVCATFSTASKLGGNQYNRKEDTDKVIGSCEQQSVPKSEGKSERTFCLLQGVSIPPPLQGKGLHDFPQKKPSPSIQPAERRSAPSVPCPSSSSTRCHFSNPVLSNTSQHIVVACPALS